MSTTPGDIIRRICATARHDRSRLLGILTEIQRALGCVSPAAMCVLAGELSMHLVEVESVASFYSFITNTPKGRFAIRLCNDIADIFKGAGDIAGCLECELGIKAGETTSDGTFSLDTVPSIGMGDQAPAALINDSVFTHLTSQKVRSLISVLRCGRSVSDITIVPGDGNNSNPLIQTEVCSNIRKRGPVLLSPHGNGGGLQRAAETASEQIINEIKSAGLRGRGGAGFHTGTKWEMTASSPDPFRYVICNADEGEPGTFKDRVLLTEKPDLVFEGMTIAARAVRAEKGILYLRAEYRYLLNWLNHILENRRMLGLLGENILGHPDFCFDIQIISGAGSYVCGEETALINSCEGHRGDPREKPPFPAEKGYFGHPTVLNNVETLCCAARILEYGADWFRQFGTSDTSGTELVSVSGDCAKQGVYEITAGTILNDLITEAGAEDPFCVQVSGPSGMMLSKASLGRKLCFEDIPSGGSIIIYNGSRSIPDIVHSYLAFYSRESCGFCTPCRVGTAMARDCLSRIANGAGEETDLFYLTKLAGTMTAASRCGLGQNSTRSILQSLHAFPEIWGASANSSSGTLRPGFRPKSPAQHSNTGDSGNVG